MSAQSIILAVLIFGFLIFIHELGHFLCARIFKVTVYEFSIGMGPKVLSRVSKKSGIRYSLRLLPIGGFVSMEGENGDETAYEAELRKKAHEEDKETGGEYYEVPKDAEEAKPEPVSDPNSFSNKKKWQRFLILFAGPFMNLLVGFVAMIVLVSATNVASNQIYAFLGEDGKADTTVEEFEGLKPQDTIVKVNSVSVHSGYELNYEILYNGNEPLTLTVIRDGEKIVLENVQFPTQTDEKSGMVFGNINFMVYGIKKNPLVVIQQSYFRSVSTVKMVYDSLAGLFSGRIAISEVSGPVGTTEVISEAVSNGWVNVLYVFAVITINLGVMNLLPIPALDGGQILFLLIEAVRRKSLNPTVKGLINTICLGLLLLLSVVIMVKDIINL